MELTLFISQSLLKTLPMTEAEVDERVEKNVGDSDEKRREETKQHQR